MFFLGLLIGAVVYGLVLYLWQKFEKIGWPLVAAVIFVILMFDYSEDMAWGMVAAIVALFALGYWLGKKREDALVKPEPPKPIEPEVKKDTYKSHCWHCGNPIDGSWNKKCPDCKQYYICPKCGACKCDFPKNPPYKH